MEINNIFENKPFFSKTNLKKMGFSWYKINQLVNDGIIEKLNSHFYESKVYRNIINDFNYVSIYIPNGVISLLSASNYYGYTNYNPAKIDVSIPCDKKINNLPSYPAIKLHYPKGDRYLSEIIEINNDNDCFKIYSKEKTVCDILINKTKIDSEEIKNVLIGYLNDPDKDIDKLFKLSVSLKCEDALRTYMEVLL